MFTGLVEQTGRVARAVPDGGNLRVTVFPDAMWHDLSPGESIAVDGVCLTVSAWDASGFTVDLSRETLAKTAPRWTEGACVNLERALRLGERLGGHLVSGHVDGVGHVAAIEARPGAHVVTVRADPRLAPHLVPKGSVAVDGVSLTVVDVGGPAGSRPDLAAHEFTLWLVPHTLAVTALGGWTPGRAVNLEADPIAKYVERLLALRAGAAP